MTTQGSRSERPGAALAPTMASLRRDRLARLGALVGGAVWGAFWVPVRALESAGFQGLWPVAALFGLAALLLLPLAVLRWRRIAAGGLRLQAAGLLLGGAMALYSAAFLHTEVVPAVLLYYLSPVWGFLLAWLTFGDPVTRVRWAAMALALAGAAVVLGPDTWPPLPRNAGDWMALAAGLAFVCGSTLMLTRPGIHSLDYGLSFFLWAGIGASVAAVLSAPPPTTTAWSAALPWLLPTTALLVAPGCLAAIHGASVLNPGVVAVLYMAEIGVALVLAALLTEEPVGAAQVAGVAMIALAGGLESLVHARARTRLRRRP